MPASVGAARAGRSQRLRRRLRVVLVLVTAVVVVAIAVLPTRQYLDQRDAIAEREGELERLHSENRRLEARVEALATPAEVERLARAEYGLVYPGEEIYAVLPPPESVVRVPAVWPFDR